MVVSTSSYTESRSTWPGFVFNPPPSGFVGGRGGLKFGFFYYSKGKKSRTKQKPRAPLESSVFLHWQSFVWRFPFFYKCNRTPSFPFPFPRYIFPLSTWLKTFLIRFRGLFVLENFTRICKTGTILWSIGKYAMCPAQKGREGKGRFLDVMTGY